MTLTTSSGRSVTIKEVIARGGEGAVFRTEQATLVAKLYHNAPGKDRIEKLEAMVRAQSSDLTRLACWPVDLLIDPLQRHVKGFLMPNASDFKEAHKLYSPKSRSYEFKSVDWRFLVHAATNIARAFATVHQCGHVIGDVNHSSVMVAQDATVKLIDCDSFQITSRGKRYPCIVGEAMHTAPELQGQRLDQVLRTPNHDAFGLAVLIFEILFMGRHPFAGRYLGGGDLSHEQKIGRYLFAYGNGATGRQMEQPPNTLSLSDVPPPLAVAFERAFTQSGALGTRPTAAEWVALLDQMQKSLRQCKSNEGHWHHPVSSICPWCRIEAQVGVSLFNVAFVSAEGRPGFNLALVWSSIDTVAAPPPASYPPTQLIQPARPSELAAKLRTQRNAWHVLGAVLGLVSVGVSFLVPGGVCGGVIVGLIAWWLVSGLGGAKVSETKRTVQAQLLQARSHYEQLYRQWSATATSDVFDRAKTDLAKKKNQYQGLTAYRQKEYQALQNTIRDRQLERYLDRYRIDRAQIPNIGPGRSDVLRSYGIETAADVTWQRVINVQGFGDSLTEALVRWRRSKERQFQFDASKGIDAKDVEALDHRVAHLRRSLETDLTRGANQLRELAARIRAARITQEQPLLDAMRRVAQLQADDSVL